MKTQRFLITLTLANLALQVATLSQDRLVAADAVPPVLHGRGLEIVDESGRVRASISVLPASTSPKGEAYPETVLLRLITERGRPSVKISTSEEAAGLSFSGPTGTREAHLILEAKGKTASLKLRNEDGREQVVKP